MSTTPGGSIKIVGKARVRCKKANYDFERLHPGLSKSAAKLEEVPVSKDQGTRKFRKRAYRSNREVLIVGEGKKSDDHRRDRNVQSKRERKEETGRRHNTPVRRPSAYPQLDRQLIDPIHQELQKSEIVGSEFPRYQSGQHLNGIVEKEHDNGNHLQEPEREDGMTVRRLMPSVFTIRKNSKYHTEQVTTCHEPRF